jgi:arylsulfatase A-like enzyme
VPTDQWNIKYLIRQGPKDLRLFLSLFTHNRFGKHLLPELYYLAGVPLTSLVGRDARALISELAPQGAPFFLNVFVSTTHPPFGSEYPYYTLWADREYAGESKFVMARLTDPWEIIRRQGDTKKDFDLEQVIDLYDGCVRNFDGEVQRIVEHLAACGLADNTIVVVYSDHGMEFFEHDTWGQGNSVRGDFSARVPLVIVDPRSEGVGHCSRIVRSIDLAPTLLELAGIGVPGSMDGQSLVAYLTGDRADLQLPAFNETGIWLTDVPGMLANHLRYPNILDLLEVPDKGTGTLAIKAKYRQVVIAAKDRMVCIGDWKLIYQPTTDGPLYELFNLKADPECRRNVAAAHPEIVSELQDYLEK